MIFPKLPLWAAVLLTASDVLFILAMGDPLGGRPMKMFEYLIAALVLAVLICMAIIIAKLNVDWNDAFEGFLPSKTIFANGGLYISVGILGATVMPHGLFLGSALATQDRISTDPLTTELPSHLKSQEQSDENAIVQPRSFFGRIHGFVIYALHVVRSNDEYAAKPKLHIHRENNSLGFVQAHIYHGIVNMAISLLGFAVLINSLILVLAASVFFHGTGSSAAPASLFDAHDLIRENVGKPAALLFALALLASGQSSSIIATVAGQCVSEGFLQWKVSPVIRRLLTRLLGLIPSTVVAAAVGQSGINTLLVASQVVLAIVLPFVTLPLIWLTSSKKIMSVRRDLAPTDSGLTETGNETTDSQAMVDFSNGKIVTGVGIVIWLVMVAANAYVIITLAMGDGQ
jgi:metal iron transporter